MLFPDYLFQPSDMDVSKGIVLPSPVSQSRQISQANATLVLDFGPVPKDRAMILTQAENEGQSGAAQTVSAMRISVSLFDAAGVRVERQIARSFPGVANSAIDFSGELVMMPDDFLTFVIVFNAGAAANFITASFHGVLIPRGNFQLSSLPPV